MIPLGANSRMKASLTSFGLISQNTCASRMRRAISCVTCEPKSRIRIRSCMASPRKSGGSRLGQPLVPGLAEMQPGESEPDRLDRGAEVEGSADAPVAARQVRDDAEQRRAQ